MIFFKRKEDKPSFCLFAGAREKKEQGRAKEKIRVHPSKFFKEKFGRAHIFILGRVQGVFFRENTKKKAEELKVFGWVKNLKDGRVEAVFEGEKEDVEKMVDWARHGPIFAKVDGFDLIWEDYQAEFKGFDIYHNF